MSRTSRLPKVLLASITVFVFCFLKSNVAASQSWIMPGNLLLRHDVELLVSSGDLKLTISAWPQNGRNLLQSLNEIEPSALSIEGFSSYLRLMKYFSRNDPELYTQLRAIASTDRFLFRNFGSVIRNNSSLSVSTNYKSRIVDIRLQANLLDDDVIDDRGSVEGSYVGIQSKNWWIGVGYIDQWWGGGWENSLIVSTNASSVPGITLNGQASEGPVHPLLSWVGPWYLSTSLSQMEEERFVPKALFWKMRVGFRPSDSFEVGLSRAAQFAGQGRKKSVNILLDMVAGVDNGRNSEGEEPGNQLAGYDIRYSRVVMGKNIDFYFQTIGEDEGGGLPSRKMGLIGSSFSISPSDQVRYQSIRFYFEGVDSALDFYQSSRLWDTAYGNGIYQTGYRYLERPIGSSFDRDTLAFSFGVVGIKPLASTNLVISWVALNRGNNPEVLPDANRNSSDKEKFVEVKYQDEYKRLKRKDITYYYGGYVRNKNLRSEISEVGKYAIYLGASLGLK